MNSREAPVSPLPEPRPQLAAGAAAGGTPPIVYTDYRIRAIGYLVTGAAIAATLIEQRPGARAVTMTLWLLLLAPALLWPHAAFLIVRSSRRPQRTEKIALLFDGLLGGAWLALIGLALWPGAVVAFTLLVSAMSVGGVRMVAACLAALAAGGLLAGVAAGFAFVPDTGLATSLLCLAGILAYGGIYALTLKRQARSIVVADQEKAALFDQVQARSVALAQSLERLQALHEVTTAISSSIDLQVVLDALVRHAIRVAGAEAGAIVEVESGATVFRSVASRNLSPEFLQRLAATQVDLEDRVIREAVEGKKPVQVPNLDTEYKFLLRKLALAEGYHGFLAVPIVQERITRGLILLRRARGPFDPDSVELLVALAGQAGVAIENAGLYRQLQTQQHSLEAANRAKSDFLANVSHELRTPLNAIMGYTELLLDNTYGAVPEKVHTVLERVDRNARHLLGLIDAVLDIAKIEAGHVTLQRAPCALSAVVRDVVVALEVLAQGKGLRLRASLPAGGLPPLLADARQITQVLFNLVGNAVKFTDDGEVEVSATVADRSLIVAVRDTGPGIAEADRERIFEEFQRSENSHTRPRAGAGLGLAIARRIVELHGGRLWVESRPGAGSTFSFSLPLAAAEAGPAGSAAADGNAPRPLPAAT